MSGARYIIKAVLTNLLIFKALIGDSKNKVLALPKMRRGPGDINYSIQRCTQPPVRVFFATVKYKAQVQLFSAAIGLDLNDTLFSPSVSKMTHKQQAKRSS